MFRITTLVLQDNDTKYESRMIYISISVFIVISQDAEIEIYMNCRRSMKSLGIEEADRSVCRRPYKGIATKAFFFFFFF